MDNNNLYKIYGNVLLGERFGSYTFKDEKGNDLGIIAGETIANPYFKFFSKISDRTILIVPHTRKHVLLKIEEEVKAIIKWERIELINHMSIILPERQFFKFIEKSKNFTDGIIIYNLYFPENITISISFTNRFHEVEINMTATFPMEPILCMVPIILNRYRRAVSKYL